MSEPDDTVITDAALAASEPVQVNEAVAVEAL